MPRTFPYSYNQDFRDRLFDLVCSGVSLVGAGRLMGVANSTAEKWWRDAGAMKLVGGPGDGGVARPGPVDRPGGPGHRLSLDERIEIMCGLRAGRSQAEIGRLIGRDRSVICREIKRNLNANGVYHARMAHSRARVRADRPKPFKLHGNPLLCARIAGWMDQGWSPKLISLVLAQDFPEDKSMQVSHETIYQCLYVQTRGQLRKDLYRSLSLKRPRRRPLTTDHTTGRGKHFADAFTISQRPAEANDRAVPGHWEGDLIIGTGSKSAIGTLVERSTRFTILLHLPERHTSEAVAEAMIAAMKHLPADLLRTVTWDRGAEMVKHRQITMELGAPVYFCDPHSPWQRGTNENTNRLLRHWFEKGTDLSVYSKADLRKVQDSLNRRPRPTLGLTTPAQKLAQLLQPAAV